MPVVTALDSTSRNQDSPPISAVKVKHIESEPATSRIKLGTTRQDKTKFTEPTTCPPGSIYRDHNDASTVHINKQTLQSSATYATSNFTRQPVMEDDKVSITKIHHRIPDSTDETKS